MGHWNVNSGPWNVITGTWNVNWEPWNVIMGQWNVHRDLECDCGTA